MGAALLLKVTAWCVAVLAARPLLARVSAATRHLVLTLTLGGAVALPLLVFVGPSWHLPYGALISSFFAPVPVEAVAETQPVSKSAGVWDDLGVTLASAPPTTLDATAKPPSSYPAVVSQPEPAAAAIFAWAQIHALACIWLVGLLVVLANTGRALARGAWQLKQAHPIHDPRGRHGLQRARLQLSTELDPELLECSRATVPFAWRGRDSAIVLPTTWRQWDDDRLHVVMVHELAHLRRRDAFALWIGRLAVAVWWFHPLVRAIDQQARQACEQAADDAVLRSGSRASDYAEHLIAISRALTRPCPTGVALMMSNSPDLKHRLLAILSANRSRTALTRRRIAGLSLSAFAFAVLLAGLRLAPTVDAQEHQHQHREKPEAHHGDGWQKHCEGACDSDSEDSDSYDSDDSDSYDSDDSDSYDSDDSDSYDSDDSDDSDSYDSDSKSWSGARAWKRGYSDLEKGRYDDSVDAFEAAAEAGYRPAASIYNAACGHSLAGRADEALAALRRALDLGLDRPELIAEDSDLDPLRSDPRFQALVDEAFDRAGERRDPIDHQRYRYTQEVFAMLRDSGSEDASAWAKVGTRLLMLRDLPGAAEALENAARFAREAPATALYNLACTYALDGRDAAAFEALERAITAGYSDAGHMKRDPDLASLRGDSEFERLVQLAKDLDLNRFREEWWEANDKSWKKWRHTGNSNYSPAKWAGAIEHFQDFTSREPQIGAGWFQLGYALHYSKRFDEARDAFERARELGFRAAIAAYNIACGYAMQDRVDDALVALEEAIGLGYSGDLDGDSDLEVLRDDPRFRSLRLTVRYGRDA